MNIHLAYDANNLQMLHYIKEVLKRVVIYKLQMFRIIIFMYMHMSQALVVAGNRKVIYQ